MAIPTIYSSLRRCTGAWLLALLLSIPCQATTMTTQWGGLIESVAAAINWYAQQHDGRLPANLDSLFSGSIRAGLENELGGPLSSKVLYLDGNPLTLPD